jgi:hypothetical protein
MIQYGSGSSSSGNWISQSAYYNWSGTWPEGWVEGLGYVAADANVYGGGSSSVYGSSSVNSNNAPNPVTNGNCIAGVIANALYKFGISYNMSEIESRLIPYGVIASIGSQYVGGSSPYIVASNISADQLYNILSNYFSACYESTAGGIAYELSQGSLAYAELQGSVNHAVLVTDMNMGAGTYTYRDPVLGSDITAPISAGIFSRIVILNKK